MATNLNSPKGSSYGTSSKSPQHQQAQGSSFEPIDKSSSNTLKRNPKMELNKTDLLKLLSYLEGELQARDIVIATLKSERVKQLLNQGRYRPILLNDPLAALQRDSFAAAEARVDEAEIRAIANQQMATLDNLVIQQRRSQMRLARILRDAEERHRKVVQELDEEKRKHEHDTAQGDDITYGLERERTRLKQELELERQAKKKQEKELKRVSDVLEEERNRQKQIVLLLLAERKKLIMKYVEERKRSEDLAQILTEEKGRIDSMAEGLEEESKKSLQMEAELEKQLAQFDTERQQLRAAVAKEEKRAKDLEVELEKAKAEAEALKKQLAEAHQVAMFQAGTASVSPPRMVLQRPGVAGTPPQPPAKPAVIPPQTSPRPTPAVQPPRACWAFAAGVPLTPPKVGGWGQPADGSISPPPPAAGTPMISSVAKVVQPTATVSSVPVCGPTTGIARSVSPGQGLRSVVYSPTAASEVRSATPVSSWSSPAQSSGSAEQPAQVSAEKRSQQQAQVVQVSPHVSLSASPGTKVFTTTQGGKLTFHVTANAGLPAGVPQTKAPEALPPQTKKPIPPGRGVPPPVPPNKPVVPPKKEAVSVAARRPEPASPATDTLPAEGKSQKVMSGGAQGVKFGISVTKDKIPTQGGELVDGRRDPQVGAGSPSSPACASSTHVEAANNARSGPAPASVPTGLHESPPATTTGHGFEMLDPELADFQQILISMAAGTTNIAAPIPQILPAQAANIVETDMTIYCNLSKIDIAQSQSTEVCHQ
ncbi:CTTNBP2 N-terminal-like protein isoform X4 [Periplaneta americana]|uniref:CTTNBP2 N-terminal-like protein isoform X4 n=1 Tax=Periplaneta americana TaxID=6978 RepID=UPI0037E8D5E5